MWLITHFASNKRSKIKRIFISNINISFEKGNVYTIGKLPGEVLQKQRTPMHIARKIKTLS